MLMTMTTCRRMDLFERTVKSLARNVPDMQCIDRIVVIDDSQSTEDATRIENLLGEFLPNRKVRTIQSQLPSAWRHTQSANVWLQVVRDEQFVFHCEDDWEFTNNGNPIQWSLNLMEIHDWIGQCSLRQMPRISSCPIQQNGFWIRCASNSVNVWPSRFTLSPSVVRVSSLVSGGQFLETPEFEWDFGKRWILGGWQTVYHRDGFCKHIGEGKSAYALTGSLR